MSQTDSLTGQPVAAANPNAAPQQTGSAWWGRHTLPVDRSDFWQIGSLRLWIEHRANRLIMKWMNGPDWLDAHLRHLPSTAFENPKSNYGSRVQEAICAYGVHAGSVDLVFSPALPDRSVVVRAPQPVHILPGESVTAYLVTPLWLRAELTNPSRVLQELPTFRLSDTWFGPATSAGELAYSSATSLVYSAAEVPLRPHCVVTAILIRNFGDDALKVDRLNIPYKQLSLFYSSETGFWTDSVTLERREDDETTTLKIDHQAPQEASPSQFVSGPRLTVAETGNALKAFSRIFERSEPE